MYNVSMYRTGIFLILMDIFCPGMQIFNVVYSHYATIEQYVCYSVSHGQGSWDNHMELFDYITTTCTSVLKKKIVSSNFYYGNMATKRSIFKKLKHIKRGT
jgi:hypothetical protein